MEILGINFDNIDVVKILTTVGVGRKEILEKTVKDLIKQKYNIKLNLFIDEELNYDFLPFLDLVDSKQKHKEARYDIAFIIFDKSTPQTDIENAVNEFRNDSSSVCLYDISGRPNSKYSMEYDYEIVIDTKSKASDRLVVKLDDKSIVKRIRKSDLV